MYTSITRLLDKISFLNSFVPSINIELHRFSLYFICYFFCVDLTCVFFFLHYYLLLHDWGGQVGCWGFFFTSKPNPIRGIRRRKDSFTRNGDRIISFFQTDSFQNSTTAFNVILYKFRQHSIFATDGELLSIFVR